MCIAAYIFEGRESMGSSVRVNGTRQWIVHKGSGGWARCTAPDVCKTPSPGGPVPIPYPVIVSMSSSLANGTRTVTVDRGNKCAIKGSKFSRCSGDEAGTVGGIKSNTNMKEATWILYSFDVKLEGKGACRKTDKMMMNHGNTFCMAGEDQIQPPSKDTLHELAKKCDAAVNQEWDRQHPNGPKHNQCWSHTGRTMNNGKPEPVQVALGKLKEDCVYAQLQETKNFSVQQPFTASGTALPKNTIPPYGGGTPDLIVHAAGAVSGASVEKVFDLKFPCPSSANKQGKWSEGQLEKYVKIFPNCKKFRIICPRGIF